MRPSPIRVALIRRAIELDWIYRIPSQLEASRSRQLLQVLDIKRKSALFWLNQGMKPIKQPKLFSVSRTPPADLILGFFLAS